MASAKQSVGGSVLSLLTTKSLSSMVKGIRNFKSEHAGNAAAEAEFIGKCMAEIKEELKTNFPDVKAVAIQKLIYLQMIGYEINWGAFHIIELMSAAWFGHKRIGYLAASLSFTKDTDVILLTTHLFRKGFNSSQGGGPTNATMAVEGFQYETGAAISCLANIVTPDLAQDLLSDVYGLMNSSRPYIRKKAVLVLLKIFRAWPKALRLSFDRLKEKLEDENQGVVSAAVYVICELAAKNPKNYLSLAPQFFKILTTSSNNWVLIKVVKLLGSLVPLEPRLAKKLTEPLSDIITTTPAKSLLYECVNTLLCGELRSKTVVKLCLEKLRNFIEDADQNLKYLGLLGLHKLLQKQPRVVAEHKDLILDCLSDEDITIRMRALDLITSMVSLKNLIPIVAKLRQHLDAAEGVGGNYREHVLERILFICAQDSFAYISDFEWYIGILVDLTHLQGISLENARSINTQLLEVVIRVPGVRSYVMKQMINILLANRLANAATAAASKAAVTNGAESAAPAASAVAGPASATQGHMAEVLYAVGFIIGEYTEYLSEESEGGAGFFVDLLNNLSRPEVTHLPAAVQNVFVSTMIKVLSTALLQPFDNAAVKDNLSTAKKKATTRATNLMDDASTTGATEGEGDEMAEEPAATAAPAPAPEEDLLGEEEEEDNDSYGLRKRKHPSLKRTYAQWHSWVGRLLNILHTNLPAFTRADSVEVQERAVAYLQLVKWIIVQGEWESQIERWSGASKSPQPIASGSSANKEEKKEEKSDDKSASIAAPAPVRELNLLGSLDPLGDSSLSIFDAAIAPKPAAAAAPVEPLFAAMSLSPSSPSGNGAANPALKDKLRNLAIQLGLLYAERLNPVNPKAQRKVAVPKGLDLDVEINAGSSAPPPDTEADADRSDEDDDPYSSKPRRSKPKPKGGLYDDDFSVGSGGFGARPSRKKAAGSRGDYAGSSSSGFLDSIVADKNLTPAEKEEARRRAERRKAAQMNDPYYLKDNKDIAAANAPSQALLNVDHIPVRRLDDDDLPQIKVTSSSRKSGELDDAPSGKNKKTFKVLRTDEMPENDELSSDEDARDSKHGKRSKHSKDKDRKRDKKSSKGKADSGSEDGDALDMDLTTPLKPDEFIPRVKTYAESQAASASAVAPADDKSSKRSKREKDDKERDGKKDKKHRSDRDRDRDRKSDRKDSDAPKPAAAAPAASVNLFDLFDPMGAAAPAPAAAASSTSSSSSSSRDQRKSTTSSSSSSAAAPSPSSSSSSVDRSLRDCSVFKDSSLRLRSWSVWQSGSSVLVTIEASLASDNPKKIAALPKVILEVKPGKHAKSFSAVGGSSSAVKVSDKGVLSLTLRDVTPAAAVSEKFLIDFSSPLDRDFAFAARVSYTADKSDKGKDGESAELIIPVSTFIQAKKLSASEMAQALMSSKPAPTCLAQSQMTLKRTKVSDAIRNVTGILNVSLVEAVSFTATYYGVMIANQTAVAVLVKAKKGDESSLSLEIKSASSKVSEALLEEVQRKIK